MTNIGEAPFSQGAPWILSCFDFKSIPDCSARSIKVTERNRIEGGIWILTLAPSWSLGAFELFAPELPCLRTARCECQLLQYSSREKHSWLSKKSKKSFKITHMPYRAGLGRGILLCYLHSMEKATEWRMVWDSLFEKGSWEIMLEGENYGGRTARGSTILHLYSTDGICTLATSARPGPQMWQLLVQLAKPYMRQECANNQACANNQSRAVADRSAEGVLLREDRDRDQYWLCWGSLEQILSKAVAPMSCVPDPCSACPLKLNLCQPNSWHKYE